jgi:alpha-galactosidase
MARALLDDVILLPGDEREIEPLAFWHADESAARMASNFAALLGDHMRARISSPYQRGWCSWYHYFHAITEDAMLANLHALKELRAEYPIEVVQLDDGYQAALGDWDRTNAKFPSGLKKLAAEIRDAGFIAGIWTAPFFAARDSQVMREHGEWFIKHRETGEPLRAGYNPNWTCSDDKYAYAMDPSRPEVASHLERLFRKIVEEFGYDYLKLDFLYAAAAEGVRHDPAMTRAETLRRGLEAIRRGAGERAFILGCGCPLGAAVGVVDGMRIGPDVAPYWGAATAAAGEPGTALAIDAILARSFMHRRLWLNDPDCLMLRAKETRLSNDEREALAWTIAASGGMLLISDDMRLLDADSARLFRDVARIGAGIIYFTNPR